MKRSSIIYWILSALFLLQIGCAAGPQTLPEARKSQIKTVGVVSADFEPKNNLQGFFKGRMKGLAGGVAGGAAGGLLLSIEGGPITMMFAPIFIGASAVTGGIFGAADAMPMKKVKEIESSISRLLEEFNPQQDIADHIVAEAGKTLSLLFVHVEEPRPANPEMELDYKDFDGNMDAILEISVMEVGLVRGQTGRKRFGFFMAARVRLINTIDGEELYYREHYYRGRERTFAEWTNDDASLLREEWKDSYQVLSRDIAERVFMMTDMMPFHIGPGLFGYCWLKPYDPESRYNIIISRLKFVEINSVQPTFTWETFPRDGDRMKAPEGLIDRIENVTYELKIWRVEKKSPAELIYHRSGLTEPSNTIELPLDPETRYYWSFRANYFIDGHRRVTGWSYSRNPGPIFCNETTIPYRNYFRFKTPSADE